MMSPDEPKGVQLTVGQQPEYHHNPGRCCHRDPNNMANGTTTNDKGAITRHSLSLSPVFFVCAYNYESRINGQATIRARLAVTSVTFPLAPF